MESRIITLAFMLLPFILIIEGIKAKNSGGFLKRGLLYVIFNNVFTFSLIFAQLFKYFTIFEDGSLQVLGWLFALGLLTYFTYLVYKTVTRRNITVYHFELDNLYEVIIKSLEEKNIEFKQEYMDNNSAEILLLGGKGKIKLKEHFLMNKIEMTFIRIQDICYYDNLILALEEYVKRENKNIGKFRGIGNIIIGVLLLLTMLYIVITQPVFIIDFLINYVI